MDTADSESLSTDSPFGSSWVRKKNRYDEDEFPLESPENSNFLKLHYGPQSNKQNESMYSLINKELGLSLEGAKGNVIPQLNLVPAANGRSEPPAQFHVGAAGIVLGTANQQCSQSSSQLSVTTVSNDSPAVQVPSTITESIEEKEHRYGIIDCPKKSSIAQQDVETLVRKARSGRPTRKASMNLADTFDRNLLDEFNVLRLEDTFTEKQPKPFCPLIPPSGGASIDDIAASLLESIPKVSGIRDRRRKTSAPPSLNPMLKDNQMASNYFFTGSFFCEQQNVGQQRSASEQPPDRDLSVPTPEPGSESEPSSPLKQLQPPSDDITLGQATSLMDERASEAAALEPRPKMGSKRRPRASALREMNFWAPQSS